MDKNVEKLKLILSGEVTENSDLDVGMECRVLGWDEIIDRYDPDYDENVTKMKSYCGKTFVCTLENVKRFKNCHKSNVVFDDKIVLLYRDMIKLTVNSIISTHFVLRKRIRTSLTK